MAHVVRLGSLTDELINLITVESNPARVNAYRESALRILRLNSHARTNQFEVQHQLEGLEEKFRVYNEDAIADALRQRLDELAKRSHKWAPEILHFLLELSDKPIVNSNLEDLDFLELPTEPAAPHYKWEDLAAEDPLLRDKSVWRNIDYGAESSDDDGFSLDSDVEASSLTEHTAISSTHDEYLSKPPDNITIFPDLATLEVLRGAQFWRDVDKGDADNDRGEDGQLSIKYITELQAIREVLFMLSGLPTSLFISQQQDNKEMSEANDFAFSSPSKPSSISQVDGLHNILIPTPGYALRHASSKVFQGVLAHFAGFGNSISTLRVWTASKQNVPLLQSFQIELEMRLRLFDSMMSDMQAGYNEPCQDLIVSLIELHTKLTPLMRTLMKVSDIVRVLELEPYAHAFRFLELLYDGTCASQVAGDEELYEYLGTLFFGCFRVYLRQIRKWMEEGELLGNDHVFSVSENAGALELASLWMHRYRLRKTSNGTLHAPEFLHLATAKIFTAGKSVVVLKALGKYDRTKRLPIVKEPQLDFQTVCGSPSLALAPFPELFDVALDQWIRSKHDVTSSTLRRCLFDEFGLRDSLSALENIYFMVDGNVASQFANSLFEKLDSGKNTWNDRFTLTELAQRTIGSLPGVTAEKLKATASVTKRVGRPSSRKSVKALNTFALTYSVPWPVQIIIAKESIPSYQRIFNFLLQIRRSAYLLQGFRLVKLANGVRENRLYYGVRSQLLWFTSILYSYLTDLVIDPNTKNMRGALGEAEDVDQMIELHRGYMKKMTDQALLGSKLEPIYKSVIKIFDLSIQLSDAQIMQATAKTPHEDPMASIHDISLRRSLNSDPLVRRQGLGRKKFSDSSDEDVNESEAEPSAILATKGNFSYIGQLREIHSHFGSLCKFIVTGLRGVARAGGESNWDMLADKLESGLGDVV